MRNFYMFFIFLIITIIAFETHPKEYNNEYVLPAYCSSIWKKIEEKINQDKSRTYNYSDVLQQRLEHTDSKSIQVLTDEQLRQWGWDFNE